MIDLTKARARSEPSTSPSHFNGLAVLRRLPRDAEREEREKKAAKKIARLVKQRREESEEDTDSSDQEDSG